MFCPISPVCLLLSCYKIIGMFSLTLSSHICLSKHPNTLEHLNSTITTVTEWVTFEPLQFLGRRCTQTVSQSDLASPRAPLCKWKDQVKEKTTFFLRLMVVLQQMPGPARAWHPGRRWTDRSILWSHLSAILCQARSGLSGLLRSRLGLHASSFWIRQRKTKHP